MQVQGAVTGDGWPWLVWNGGSGKGKEWTALRCNLEMKSTGLGEERAEHSREEVRRREEQEEAVQS